MSSYMRHMPSVKAIHEPMHGPQGSYKRTHLYVVDHARIAVECCHLPRGKNKVIMRLIRHSQTHNRLHGHRC
jgi:hypothetical protein